MNNTELLGLTEAVQLAPAHSCSVTYGRCTQAVRVGWAPDEGLRAAQQGRTAPEQGLGWAVKLLRRSGRLSAVLLGAALVEVRWAPQELAVCDAQAAKVHASALSNTNVYVGNLPVEVRACTGGPWHQCMPSCWPTVHTPARLRCVKC